MTTSPQTLRNLARDYSARADDLAAQYGTGVTPGWVSEELSILRAKAAQYEASARELEEKQ